MSKDDLKPCPFCGSIVVREVKILSPEQDGFIWYVTCMECFTAGPRSKNPTIAISRWNTAVRGTQDD